MIEVTVQQLSGSIKKDLLKINSLEILVPKDKVDSFYQILQDIAQDDDLQEFYLSPLLEYRLAESTPYKNISALTSLNDTYQSLQWYLDTIDLPEAWRKSSGSKNIIIAIVDTGIDQDHPEFQGRIDPNSYNFYHDNNNITDYHGHGTHVAGILSAESNNSIGITGVANVTLLIEKAYHIDDTTGDTILANSIIHATDNGAIIISNSWSGDNYSLVIHNAIKYANDRGVITVFAAGNNNTNQLFYPAALSETLAVGATDSSDTKASYSNYGSYINLTAPGSSIYSTLPGNSYGYKSGTSMSTPIVAGVLGLMFSYYDTELTAELLYQSLDKIADDKGTTGRDDTYGWGRINANKALTLINRPFTADWNYTLGNGATVIEEQAFFSWEYADPDIEQEHYSTLSLTYNAGNDQIIYINTTDTNYNFFSYGLENRSDYIFRLEIYDGENQVILTSPALTIKNPPQRPQVTWSSPHHFGQTFQSKEELSVSFNIIEFNNESFSYKLYLTNNHTTYLINQDNEIYHTSILLTWNTSFYPNGGFNYELLVDNGYYLTKSTFNYFILNNTHAPQIKISLIPYYPTTMTNTTWTKGLINVTITDYDTDNVTLQIQVRINTGDWETLYIAEIQDLYIQHSLVSYILDESNIQDYSYLEVLVIASDTVFMTHYLYRINLIRPKEPELTIIRPSNQTVFDSSFLIQWKVTDPDSNSFNTSISFKKDGKLKSEILLESTELTKNNTQAEYYVDIDLSKYTTGIYDFIITIADGYYTKSVTILNITIQKNDNTGVITLTLTNLFTQATSNDTSKNSPAFEVLTVLLLIIIVSTRKTVKDRKH